ncbi:Cytosine-specific methyltransferase (modular protein) [Nitrospina gracilis 3/211]|uniref:Cytosine-specific methyltransferase n=1 Tax=Nitrospina gracilis (strain 3/211) TaxID=1266370 RepID=M1YYP8_NITG3|nr:MULTISPECIES: DNA cytosine methyltransferase [Nitrospina]MCF8723335.1 DNA (cytosine-5)-methyltransferase 1 [Nitrospina sp. Nb-3]CCQ90386.1 Cytosine-specific methyltransferase (modular protein) [Nitrospina gracilis 3/211]
MPQIAKEPKTKRAAAIRKCQSERRKRLKTLTIEVDKETHGKIKMLANIRQTTLQGLLFDTLKSLLDSQSNLLPRPWSVLEPLREESKCERTHVSLFSGCGGIDLGFRQAGFKTVFANDLDPDACSTYRSNLGEIVEGDIHTVSLPRMRKKLDILSAGFPCQPFSNAGSRKGIKDKRGTLYQTALEVVEELKPRAVVFENVRGLLSFKTEKKLLIEEICEHLDFLGYDVLFSLVDASKHHVPQKRLRVFMVGIERAKKNGRFSFPAPVERNDLTLKHTILDICQNTQNQQELIQLNPQAIHIGSMVPEGGSWKSIPYEKLPERLKKIADNMEKYRWPNFYRRFHRNEVAGTITAAFKPENAGVWHPLEQRVFSVREIARIQSFPDWFRFEGRNIKSKYQQIGNAVPPRLAYELAAQIDKTLNGEDLRGESGLLTFEQFVKTGKPLRACDRDVVFSKSGASNNEG